jgi:hypothetical protein
MASGLFFLKKILGYFLLELLGKSAPVALTSPHNPMHPTKNDRFDVIRLQAARRCSARSKRSGKQCRGPAVRGRRVCRMHGAGGGAPAGKRNGNYRNGGYTKEAIFLMRDLNMLGRMLKRLQKANDLT